MTPKEAGTGAGTIGLEGKLKIYQTDMLWGMYDARLLHFIAILRPRYMIITMLCKYGGEHKDILVGLSYLRNVAGKSMAVE